MLLERDDLLESLERRRVEAAGGDGSLVLIAGEAGAGKSTLVKGYLDRLDSSTLAIVGACDPLSTPRPLGPLYDFAADPDSGLDDLELGHRDPVELFAEVLDRLRRTIRPIVMVVEDIHWSDEATRDFLRFIGRRVADTKAVVLCTYRDDEIGAGHELRPLLGQLGPLETTVRLAVPPLSVAAVAGMVGDTGLDATRLHDRTSGNAFFITEILASRTSIPTSVEEAVLARFSHVSPEGQQVIEAVSIAPRSLGIDQATSLAGVPLAAVDAALATGTLLAEGNGLRFRHELAREAVESSLPPARRLELHRRMVDMLESIADRDPAEIAHHAVRANAPELIARYAPLAAEDAIARGARREAIAFYEAALLHDDALGLDRTAELWLRLGSELTWIKENSRAVDALDRAITLFRELGDVEAEARALVWMQGPLWETDGEAAGRAATERALALLSPRGPSESLAFVLTRIAHNHMITREKELADRVVAEAARMALLVGSSEMQWRAEMLRGTVELVMGDPDVGIAALEASVRAAEAEGNHQFVNSALGMLGSGAGEARRYRAATSALLESVEHGLATDDDTNVAYSQAWLARVAFEQGRWDDAALRAEQSAAWSADAIATVTAKCVLGRVRVRRGDPGGLAILREVVEVGDGFLFQYVWNAYCGTAEHAWLSGDPEPAVDLLDRAYSRAMASDSPWARGEVGFWMWRLGAIDGPPGGAAEPFALQMSGEWRAAADRWQDIGCPYEAAMALADGDAEAMTQSLEILDRLGATPAGRLVRGRLREAGVTSIPRGPSRATQENPANLTPRQLEVLTLMAGGASNAEIANRIFVSKKTVEHHVSAIYLKLDVDSRARAVAAAHALGVVET